MNERNTLHAYFATLFAICYLATVAALLAARHQYAEALGFGGLTTGLVGVLGTFKPRQQSPDSPVPVAVVNTPPSQVE